MILFLYLLSAFLFALALFGYYACWQIDKQIKREARELKDTQIWRENCRYWYNDSSEFGMCCLWLGHSCAMGLRGRACTGYVKKITG